MHAISKARTSHTIADSVKSGMATKVRRESRTKEQKIRLQEEDDDRLRPRTGAMTMTDNRTAVLVVLATMIENPTTMRRP